MAKSTSSILAAGTAEKPWFRIFVAILAICVAGVSIANVIYYSRLSKGGTVTKGEGYAMMVISILILIPSLFVMLWAIFKGAPKKYQAKVSAYTSGLKYDK